VGRQQGTSIAPALFKRASSNRVHRNAVRHAFLQNSTATQRDTTNWKFAASTSIRSITYQRLRQLTVQLGLETIGELLAHHEDSLPVDAVE
jgi:hypothetical protein